MYMTSFSTLGSYLIETVSYYMENNQNGFASWNKRNDIIKSSHRQQDPIGSQFRKRNFQNPFVPGLSP